MKVRFLLNVRYPGLTPYKALHVFVARVVQEGTVCTDPNLLLWEGAVGTRSSQRQKTGLRTEKLAILNNDNWKDSKEGRGEIQAAGMKVNKHFVLQLRFA